MKIDVKYLENLRIEALFDDFNVISDQPIRYKGDGTAPGPFDYFLASSAMCAAYFVKVYCNTRDIPTQDISLRQNNIVDPDNRYKQTFDIQIELPESISEKDKNGIIASMERCSVKRVIQNDIDFKISATQGLTKSTGGIEYELADKDKKTMIPGKDCSLEETILSMTKIIEGLGIKLEIASWRNQVPHVWSVHIRDADSPMCFTNGKGTTKDSALCSALGEYLERISNNYFYNDYYLGEEVSNADFVHYKNEKWFPLSSEEELPEGLMDEYLINTYAQDGELMGSHLIDTNSGNIDRGVCALPFIRQSDKKEVFIPVNLIGNLFVSNGMSAGNTINEARVQCLSEIFERAIKNKIISEEITLPDVPKEILEKYPTILEGVKELESKGFAIVIKDASLGGRYPVMCVTLMNPKNGGVFASFGAHPKFEVALERSLTELLQGRSFEGMNDTLAPTFNSFAISEHNNIVDHFIDSTGVVSWKFFSSKSDFKFSDWDFSGTTEQENSYLMDILKGMQKEVYIADYTDLGASACRILVPDFSEIYEKEDLIWDNHNRALSFRNDILNLHSLDDTELNDLFESLVESELDDYMPISELVGIAFDENTTWGQLNIGELKGLILLSLNRLEEAQEYTQMFLAFNDNLPERKKFYSALSNIIEIELSEELNLKDYKEAFSKMYDKETLENAIGSVAGEVKFYGLTKTNTKLEGLDKHLKLIESYKKLLTKRALS
jgi:ribosomal protein S12 methylthiotransferase accessory factor